MIIFRELMSSPINIEDYFAVKLNNLFNYKVDKIILINRYYILINNKKIL